MKRTFFLCARLFGIVTVVVLFGCAGTLPPAKPLDSERAAIGIAVKTRGPVKLFGSSKVDAVYFIKLDELDSTAAASYQVQSNQIMQSNYSKGGQMYLLNAVPGRYAVVAVFDSKSYPSTLSAPREVEYTTFFSKDLIKLTEVTVTPRSIVFMGDYVVDQSLGLKEADEAQSYYFNLIVPGGSSGLLGMAFSGKNYYKGSLHEHKRDPQTEMNFFIKAQEHLQEAGWANLIQQRMDDLKAQTPEKIITQKKGGIQ